MCGGDTPREALHADGRCKDGIAKPPKCLPCMDQVRRARNRADMRKRRAANPDLTRQRYRTWQLKSMYGLSLIEYEALLAAQGGVCAICEMDNRSSGKDWHVDHDHDCCPTTPTCGRCNRGILCARCNLMLGMARNSGEILHRASDYLSQGRAKVLKTDNYFEPDVASVIAQQATVPRIREVR
jgi:hypothetical protein